ncbi:zinc ribbon domain-containing protein [Pseudonocardia asaccharolytica]|uniref:zinc ribbon domain-containing protein n=1 Tax=Pseudonocardia asaccharolytica TaxID=54010 RepID=UPI003CCC297A
MRAKAGLNRAILASGWGLFATRLGHKTLGRVEKIDPAFTSRRCSVCGHTAAESRQSQALLACVACGHTSNADPNAARNIAAGRAARGAAGWPAAVNREPQHCVPSRLRRSWNPPPSGRGGRQLPILTQTCPSSRRSGSCSSWAPGALRHSPDVAS